MGRLTRSRVFEEPVSAFKRECKVYELLPDAPSDVDQLQWWRQHQEQFPLLSHLVRVVFAVPAASSKNERVFSVAGLVVSALRNRLDPRKVENIIAIKSNLRLLKDMGVRK